MIGEALEALSPELLRMIAEGKERAIITHAKGTELLTLAVKVAPGTSGHVITFEDITRQLLDQRQAAWSDVARRIAHEIKNPLTPIQLATERLKRRYRTQVEESEQELFDDLTSTIVRQVGDLRRMVDEFSSFARTPKPRLEEEDVTVTAKQVLFLMKVGHPEVQFVEDLPDEPVRAKFDRRLISQALTNIIKNATEGLAAREAPDEPGRIKVHVHEQPEGVVSIEVSDNGIGFPTENRQRLLEPYMTTRAEGTGLGLPIVAKILEDHGGGIELLDAEWGRGARVRIFFPIQREGADAVAAAHSPSNEKA
jgi:two-component system nitrogen regulation sensor histidine kinase NtrY